MFEKIIGQSSLKGRLAFHLESFRKKCPLPHYLFTGAAGGGKSMFFKEIAREIKSSDDAYSVLLINCATIKDVDSFYRQVYEPHIQGKKTVIGLDESHNLPNVLQQLFLTTIEVDDKIERTIPTDSGEMKINTLDHVFMFLSSEPDRLFKPLLDRMEIISLAEYSTDELSQILVGNCKKIRFDKQSIEDISEHLRGNPRDAIKLAKEITRYCLVKNLSRFTHADWKLFCKTNDMKPFGLLSGEIQVLKVLAQNGGCSLNDLRAATGISRTAIMNNLEPYLLYKHFIKIDGKRHVTNKGREAWKALEGRGF